MNQVLRGTGLVSGGNYLSINSGAFTLNAPGLPFEQTSIANYRLLSLGAGSDLFVSSLQHITVDALGNLRVYNTDFRFECK